MPRVDPYKNYRFLVEIDGIVQAGFSECSGFGSEVEVVEYREGGDDATVRKLRGKASYPDISLKWGLTDSRELYDWHLAAVNGQIERKNGSIIVLDDTGQEKVRWNFFQAWASKYEAPGLDAKGSEFAVVTLTMVCELLVRA
ncbi:MULTISPECIES: phage tail protein [unclassified Okeania]|uniref:phage tail protein n=1 Tax=unclassified Okeania TaxID=2634635 RepID=UPI0013BD9BBF|nr:MULTISPECIES: phage tail protein [unclassified Okeania]NES77333.1 phage tail protein [Okeania sp. SIO1H4]NET22691.1 phage tail protein [Okeania sp. SIO1H5]NET95813.1 phage tail protein [Okeania sp. SIO1H2]